MTVKQARKSAPVGCAAERYAAQKATLAVGTAARLAQMADQLTMTVQINLARLSGLR